VNHCADVFASSPITDCAKGATNWPLHPGTTLTHPDLHSTRSSPFPVPILCSSLDRSVLLKRGPGDSQDAYLGLLYPTEDYKVYGWVNPVRNPALAASQRQLACRRACHWRRCHGEALRLARLTVLLEKSCTALPLYRSLI
jgi:hypothetical protein